MRGTLGVVQHTCHHAMEKLVVMLLVCPPNEQLTVAVPPDPRDSMRQVQSTTPLLPTGRAEPSNARGARPVEYTTLAVQTAPAAVLVTMLSCGLQFMTGGCVGGMPPRLAHDLPRSAACPTQGGRCATAAAIAAGCRASQAIFHRIFTPAPRDSHVCFTVPMVLYPPGWVRPPSMAEIVTLFLA
jgi:hypothetical protein